MKITDQDLRNLRALAQSDKDTNWLKFGDGGLVCGLRQVVTIAATPELIDAIVTEMLDGRARKIRDEEDAKNNHIREKLEAAIEMIAHYRSLATAYELALDAVNKQLAVTEALLQVETARANRK